ncbi:MAG: hypothetical protein GOV15_00920, partial [Candidatus Diapherotrites archaeon]|nr:hypothetical protein [Candidatus Diapherotrites archaeon]
MNNAQLDFLTENAKKFSTFDNGPGVFASEYLPLLKEKNLTNEELDVWSDSLAAMLKAGRETYWAEEWIPAIPSVIKKCSTPNEIDAWSELLQKQAVSYREAVEDKTGRYQQDPNGDYNYLKKTMGELVELCPNEKWLDEAFSSVERVREFNNPSWYASFVLTKVIEKTNSLKELKEWNNLFENHILRVREVLTDSMDLNNGYIGMGLTDLIRAVSDTETLRLSLNHIEKMLRKTWAPQNYARLISTLIRETSEKNKDWLEPILNNIEQNADKYDDALGYGWLFKDIINLLEPEDDINESLRLLDAVNKFGINHDKTVSYLFELLKAGRLAKPDKDGKISNKSIKNAKKKIKLTQLYLMKLYTNNDGSKNEHVVREVTDHLLQPEFEGVDCVKAIEDWVLRPFENQDALRRLFSVPSEKERALSLQNLKLVWDSPGLFDSMNLDRPIASLQEVVRYLPLIVKLRGDVLSDKDIQKVFNHKSAKEAMSEVLKEKMGKVFGISPKVKAHPDLVNALRNQNFIVNGFGFLSKFKEEEHLNEAYAKLMKIFYRAGVKGLLHVKYSAKLNEDLAEQVPSYETSKGDFANQDVVKYLRSLHGQIFEGSSAGVGPLEHLRVAVGEFHRHHDELGVESILSEVEGKLRETINNGATKEKQKHEAQLRLNGLNTYRKLLSEARNLHALQKTELSSSEKN